MISQNILVVVDSDIPFIRGVLEPFFRVIYIKGVDISNELVKEADALVIRTRTRCNKDLLANSSVKAIFTATIGMDHIDTNYCNSSGIKVYNAAGCNSGGVLEYVVTAIFNLAASNKINLKDCVVGVVGVGNVGSKVASFFELLGCEVLRCDPPKASWDSSVQYFDLDYLLKRANIITMHTPLDLTTKNLCSYSFFEKLKSGALFVNTSRGEVVDEEALLKNISKLGGVAIDVWQNEPMINRELLQMSDIATPHIAGYSYEGKINATTISVNNLGRFFNIRELADFISNQPLPSVIIPNFIENSFAVEEIAASLLSLHPILQESSALKERPQDFEHFRANYNYRAELPSELIEKIKNRWLNSK